MDCEAVIEARPPLEFLNLDDLLNPDDAGSPPHRLHSWPFSEESKFKCAWRAHLVFSIPLATGTLLFVERERSIFCTERTINLRMRYVSALNKTRLLKLEEVCGEVRRALSGVGVARVKSVAVSLSVIRCGA